MTARALLRRFEAWQAAGRTLALATVIGTEGSTYTKAGHRILIADDGDWEGLVSGGCLEGDLATHARRVIATGTPEVVTYDLRGGNDELFGLGIGCDGLLRILLERLTPAGGYEPFAGITRAWLGDRPERRRVTLPDGSDFHSTLQPIPRLLVLGAGPDAVPVVGLADLLGWRVTVADHRPAWLERPGLGAAEALVALPAAGLAGELPATLALATFAAAIVMNHHLAADRACLAALAASPVPYVGLLGPPGRRDRLLRELGPAAAPLAGRLHGPAGLDIGADSPEAIALSILAEIHRLRSDRP